MNINPIRRYKFNKIYKTIKNSGLFDGKYYLFNYADVRNQDIDPIKHYILNGAKEGRNPSSHFDTNYYLTTYKDINVNKINPLFHYIVFGWKENRNPSLSFDTKFYLDTYKDVKESGINPLLHFVKYGKQEGRKTILCSNKIETFHCKRILERVRNYWNYENEDLFIKKINLEIEEFINRNNKYEAPLISIVMPTYNRENSISMAIESVLKQTYNNFELIIVDDCSTDNTESIVKNYQKNDKRVKYYKIDKGGVSKARNRALTETKGEYVFFLDSDNRWRQDFLFIMINYMMMKNLDAAYSAIAMTSDFEKFDRFIGTEYDFASLLDLNFIDMNAFGFKIKNKDIFFDESLKRLVDWDFILSVVYMNKVEYIPFIGVNYYDGNNGNRITHVESLKNEQNKSLIETIQKKHIENNLKVKNEKKDDFSIAVIIHAYYLNLLPEIFEKLQNITTEYDLYITTPHNEEEIKNYTHKYNLEAKIFKFNNVGRDIGPFLYMLPTLQQYALVLKLHTKRDVPNHAGSLWRDELLKNLLPSQDLTLELIEKFKDDKNLSIAGPEDFYINDSKTYKEIDRKVRKKYKQLTKKDLSGNYGFFAGTMFWFNPSSYKLLEYYYQEVKFQKQIGENGSIEHILERLLGAMQKNDIALINNSKLKILDLHKEANFTTISQILNKLNNKKGKIFFYPDYTTTNPYQNIMYSNLRKYFDIAAGSIDNVLQVQKNSKNNSIVFHLHWTSVLVGGENEVNVENTINKFIEKIKEFKKNDGVFVWTIHNLISHDTKFKDLEIHLCRELSILADNIHVHSKKVIELVSEYYKLDEEKVIVGEHGSYLSVYPNTISRENARKKLNLKEDDLVFLFLGQIRHYKGIDELLENFLKINKSNNVKLIIAGKPVNYDIKNLQINNNSIITDFRTIPDEELQVFLKASDFMVLPYTQILTSGSIYLSLSYGLPLISPNIGLLSEVLEDQVDSILYSPLKANSLFKSLEYAVSLSSESMINLKKNAFLKAKKLTWSNMQNSLFIAFSKSFIKDVRISKYKLLNNLERNIILNKNFINFNHSDVELGIVILHYKHLEDTKRVINSILNQKNVKYEIFIVSNDEDYHSFIELSIIYSNLNIIQTFENLGYAGGNNIAIDIAFKNKIPNILVVNPDLELEKESVLQDMLMFSNNNPDVSIFGPRIMYGHRKDIIWFNGATVDFDNGLNTEHLDIGKKVNDINLMAKGTDYITGACIFIKQEIIEKLGLIPEEYFLYFEETDYCINAKRENYKLMVVPSIEVLHHKRSEEGNIPSIYYLYYFCKSALLMTKKYDERKITLTTNILNYKSSQWLERIKKIAPSRYEISNKAINAGIEDGLKGLLGKIDLEERLKG